MERPIDFVESRGPFVDACSLYKVKVRKPISVLDLIDYVLAEKGEWGYIDVNEHRLEYRYGTIVSDNLTDMEKQTEIKDVFAYGGWSMMDYNVNSESNPFRS